MESNQPDPQIDNEIFEKWEKMRVQCFQIALGYSRNRAEAEDLAHAIWLKVRSVLHKYDPEKGEFEPWWRTTAHNYCKRYLILRARRDGVLPFETDEENSPHLNVPGPETLNPDFIYMEKEMKRHLWKAVQKQDRNRLEDIIFKGKTHGEVSKEVGVSEDAQKKWHSRKLKELRDYFQKILKK